MHPFNKIIRLDEIDSTNNYLKQLARDTSVLVTERSRSTLSNREVAEGTVVIAEFQSGGRGQQGNSWFSSKGKNLLFSLLVRPKKLPASEMFILSCITSLAIEKTLAQYAGNFTIKWPNDIYWNDKKIGGILIENTLQEGYVQRSVIGIGLNINERSFPPTLPNPVSLCQIAQTRLEKKQILDEFLREFSALYQQFDSGITANIRDEYMQKLYRAHDYHWFADLNGTFEAIITNVLPSGHLVLNTKANEERKYAFKEVRFVNKSTG